ncbi:putative Chloramphenicol O-acetyltransferase [groundwater metagenome]|uniref:Putative Chloramphenicol O-acetyltransferase n=1 Tax=groundwater metagenome TaxID=717931 RepID=A0A098EES6_9ZZZZ
MKRILYLLKGCIKFLSRIYEKEKSESELKRKYPHVRGDILIYGPGQVEIRLYTYIGGKLKIYTWFPDEIIKIGKYCSISENVTILGGGNHNYDNISTYPFKTLNKGLLDVKEYKYKSRKETIIGNDVWIGMNVTVLGGVRIGDGVVIGAGSVVTKDVCPYNIVAGNPAKIIKYRFTDEQIKQLLEIKWWDWPEEQIEKYQDMFYKDINEFVKYFK